MEIGNGNLKMEIGRETIKGFQDLRVYQNLYKSMIVVHTEILPKLPKDERFDLKDQMRRASKAAPALLQKVSQNAIKKETGRSILMTQSASAMR